MGAHIMAAFIAIAASIMLVNGVISFAKQVNTVSTYRGPFIPSNPVVLTGAANDAVSFMTVVTSTTILLMIIGFWIGLISFGWVFIVSGLCFMLNRFITLVVIEKWT
jgi:hypothetical protein